MSNDAVAWSGNCEDCDAIVIVAPYDDRTEEIVADGPGEWESFPSCYLCGGSIDWVGSDPISKFGLY
jgi:hypothetical protein